jgi:cyclopropane fatty-acyl-phospholipid synthase-like methyltransferase
MAAPGGFDDAEAFWDRRFAAAEYVFGIEPNVFLTAQQARFSRGMRVLEVGCGEGRNCVWLAQRGCQVTGIDISQAALGKAAQLAAERKVEVEWIHADIRHWAWQPDRFDAVVCIFIQFAAPEGRERIFAGIHSTLVAGGTLVLQGYTPRQLQFSSGGPRDPEHLYTPELLRRSLTGFDILHLEEHDAVLAEGTKHVGEAALIDLVGRKRG